MDQENIPTSGKSNLLVVLAGGIFFIKMYLHGYKNLPVSLNILNVLCQQINFIISQKLKYKTMREK